MNGQCKTPLAIGTESINISSSEPQMNESMCTWTICPQLSASNGGGKPDRNLYIINKPHLGNKEL